MKRFIIAIVTLVFCAAPLSQAKTKVYNKYNMELVDNGDGTYSVNKKCLKLLDGATPEGLTEPYKAGHPVSTKSVADVPVDTIVYKSYPGYDLHIYVCKANSEQKTPCVFFCHGGGWTSGNPSSMLKFTKYMAKYAGITAVDVQYSLAVREGLLLEDTVKDYMDAIAYVQQHADELNIDPERLGFVGHSAGGHLSAAVAMLCPQAKALVGWSGVYNLVTTNSFTRFQNPKNGHHLDMKRYYKDFDKEYVAGYSPVNLIPTDRSMSVMLFFGGCDVLVAPTQAREFGPALEAAGHKVSMEYYDYYGHSMHRASDKSKEIWKKTVNFLKANL